MRFKKHKLPLATQSAKGRSIPLTAESLVNMYAEAAPEGARNRVALIGCPGLSLFASVSTGFGDYIRGLYFVPSNETLWCVVGLTLYKISSAGTPTTIGTIGGYGRVSMADNGVQLMIVAESISYVVTLASDTLTAITDSDFPNADTVAFQSGYFVFNNNQSGSKGQFFYSALYAGTTYDALDFATAESQSDNLVAVWRDHDRVLMFGTHTTESWFASGDADAVFSPYKGAVVNRGLGARWSVANVDNRVFFLDNEGVVRVADGQGSRISTHAIEYEISQGNWRHDDATAYDGAVASSYIEEGHEFYVLTVPSTGTFVYDAATGLWHKRKSRELKHSRASFHVRAFGKILCGDTETGKLYEQKLDFTHEAGDHLIVEAQFPPIYQNNDRFRVHELELVVEGAAGYQAGVSEVTTIDVSTATSGGKSFNLEAPAGKGQANPTGLYMRMDGDEFFVCGTGGVTNWTVGFSLTDWDLDTAAYDTGNEINPGFTDPSGLSFNSSGTIMYKTRSAGAEIKQFALSSAWDLTTATLSKTVSVSAIDSTPSDLYVKSDGTKLYFVGSGNDKVYEYNMTSGDIDLLVLSDSFSVASQLTAPSGLFFTSDGTIMLVCGGQFIYQYDLSSAWSVGSAVYSGNVLDVASLGFPDAKAMHFEQDQNLLFIVAGQRIYDINLTTTTSTVTTTGIDGDITGDIATDPQIMLDVHGCGNRVPDITQPWRSMGKEGEHCKRVIWRRLGQHRTFTPRFTISAPVKRIFIDATARITMDG